MPVIPVNINCQGPPLAPLHRAWKFGKALRVACDAAPEKIAIVGAGGISHWPATPDSGKINEEWDRRNSVLYTDPDFRRWLHGRDDEYDLTVFKRLRH